MVFTGKNSYAYWGIEGTALAGDPSSDQNIPFNPLKSFTPPKPKWVDTEEFVFSSLSPYKLYSGELAPGEGAIEALFQDPMLMLACFTEKTIGGTWGTGTGTITFGFSAETEADTMFIQYHLHNQAATAALPGHVNRLIKGVLPSKYSWIIEKGKLLKEVATIKGLNFADVVNPMNCSADFHDGQFTKAAVAEITSITCQAKADLADNQYFFIYGPSGSYSETKHHVWYDVTGSGVDPAPSGSTAVKADVSGATSATDVAVIVAAALDALALFGASADTGVVTVTAANGGYATDAVDVDTGDTIVVTTQGDEVLGGFGAWDDTGLECDSVATGKRSSSNVVLHWDDAVIDGLNIETMQMDVDLAYETTQVYSSKTHTVYWRSPRAFTLRLTGKFNNKDELVQAESAFCDRSIGTIKVYADATVDEEKYIQCTNCYVSPDTDTESIPEAGKPLEFSIVIKGGELFEVTGSGKYLNLPDPSALVSH